jgi:uncharacterized protein (TIGR02996 family)
MMATMTDEEALLAAICAAPDDDTLRLVYADWLDEHRRHDRAEFIRIQVELAKQIRPEAERRESERREAALLGRRRREWLRPIRDLLPSSRCEFRRGFVEAVQAEASLYLRSTAELYQLTPLRDIEVIARNATDLVDLSLKPRPRYTRLRAVAWNGYGWEAHPMALDVLALSPPSLEPHLRTGGWLILAWAIRSEPDRAALVRLGESVLRHRWPVAVGARPFDDPAEFIPRCGDLGTLASPVWLRFSDGRLVRCHTGLNPPGEYPRVFWDEA